MSSRTDLIILADATLYREAWRALLSNQPGIVPVGTVGDPSEIPTLLHAGRPTAILVDAAVPLPPLVRQLRQAAPEAGLLVLVASYDLGEVLDLLQAGATGCISRDEPAADLPRAIIAVGRGEVFLPPRIAVRALTAIARGESSSEALVEPLSDREVEVLQLLSRGLTNKEIAQTLFLSVRTVEAHLHNIYGKLGVGSRTEAVLWAVKHGYAPAE